MTHDNPDPFGPGPVERPTRAADLRITAEPTRMFTAWPWVTTEYLITTFGIAGSIATGTVGAVVTLRIAPWLAAVAVAELVVALAGAVLIALSSRAHRRTRATGQPQDDPGAASRAE
jgi:uncharacterized membrane protein YeaQ/YmgE (transglycosylase-associated protein family)